MLLCDSQSEHKLTRAFFQLEIKRCRIEKKWIAVKDKEGFINDVMKTLRDAEKRRDGHRNDINNEAERSKQFENGLGDLNKCIERLNSSILNERNSLGDLLESHSNIQDKIASANNDVERVRTRKCRIEGIVLKLEEEMKSGANR